MKTITTLLMLLIALSVDAQTITVKSERGITYTISEIAAPFFGCVAHVNGQVIYRGYGEGQAEQFASAIAQALEDNPAPSFHLCPKICDIASQYNCEVSRNAIAWTTYRGWWFQAGDKLQGWRFMRISN